MIRFHFALCMFFWVGNCIDCHSQMPDVFGKVFSAQDSLPVSLNGESTAPDDVDETRLMLNGLRWDPEAFDVTCEKPLEWRYDCLIRFPSARKSGDRVNDAVVAEWHMARNDQGEIIAAPGLIALQGISLGGFISATAAGIDGKFDSVFIMLAGTKLEEMLASIEPNRVASRLDPRRTWLFSAKNDTVVPLENAQAWATAVGLDSSHHIILEADHYSGVTYMPTMVFKVRDLIQTAVSAQP